MECYDCEQDTKIPHWCLLDDGYKAHRIPLCELCFQERKQEEEKND
jgi:hypothetical protein